MNLLEGTNASTAASIFDSVNNLIEWDNIQWDHCISIGLDNTNANIWVLTYLITAYYWFGKCKCSKCKVCSKRVLYLWLRICVCNKVYISLIY